MKKVQTTLLAIIVGGLASTVSSQNIWNAGVTGDWAVGGNWNTATSPNGGGAEGWFGVSTAATTANINGDVGTSGSRNGRTIQGYTGSVGLNSTVNVNSGTLFMNEGFYVNFAGANNMNSTLNIAAGANVDISFGGSGSQNPGSLVMNLGNTTCCA